MFARQMGHSISEIAGTVYHPLIFSITYVLRILMEGITSLCGQCSCQLWVLNYKGQRYLARIVCNFTQVSLVQIPSTFNEGGTRHISNRSIDHSLGSLEYRSRRPTMKLNKVLPIGF